MCARMSPTRRSSQNSDWVVTDFETGVHTRTRSPQLNDDNLSSNQVADALANDMTTAFARLIPSDARTAVSYEARPSPASVHNKPPSNGDSSSTETAGTDDTVTGPSSATTTATTTTTTTTTSPQGPAPNPSSPSSGDAAPLTQSNMALHQRELFAQLCLGFVGDASISGWVAGSGTGARLLPLPPGSSTGSGKASLLSSMPSSSSSSSSSSAAAANSTGAAAHYSCPVVSSPSLGAASVTSHSSLGGQQDWMFVPLPLQFDEEVAAAGAWCEMAVGSRVRRREASLSLSECSI